MKRITAFLLLFMVAGFRMFSQAPMTNVAESNFFYQDSLLNIQWTLVNSETDPSTFELTIKPTSGYSLAIKNYGIDVFEINKKDSLVSLIWIVTPDIHTDGYYLRRYNTCKPFSKRVKVTTHKHAMSLGIQLVVIDKSKSKGRHTKYFYAPNDGRLIEGLKTIWLSNISTGKQNINQPITVNYLK